MFKRRKGRPSLREQIEKHNASDRYYAAAYGKEPAFQRELPAVRTRQHAKQRPHASEHQEQSAVISWWWRVHPTYKLPVFALFAVPNGGARDPITGSRLKAEGVRPGAYDLILAKAAKEYHGLFIEMKVGNNKPTDTQEEFGAYLVGAGYKAAVHWSATAAIAEIENYLELLP